MSGDDARYKYYRNLICKLTRISRKQYYHKYFNDNLFNMRKTWEGINSLLNRKKKHTKTIETLKNPGSSTYTIDKSKISNILNEHFTSVGANLAKELQTPEKHFSEFLDLNKSPVSPSEVKLEILSMPSNKSYGFYSCPTFLLKIACDNISDVIATIYNKSFALGLYPSKLKMAKVIPIFKADDDTDPNNYRPISLLSSFNQIFERLLYNRMKEFIDKNNILCTSQYGFRQGHSTEHAILDIVNAIQSNMDKGAFSCGVFIDLKKAFDTVDHRILLHKLKFYGFRGFINAWFASYLNEWSQVTVVGCHSSDKSQITCGVPQGSVLGPLLFLLYINDICYCSQKLNFYLFADDTNILFSHRDLKLLEKIMNDELSNVYRWLVANKLTLNLKKSNFVIFRPHQKKQAFTPIIKIFDNQTNKPVALECKEFVKYLGVLIDFRLSWNNHIDAVLLKISKPVGLLSKLRYTAPFHTLISIYNSLITPYLRYGLIAWGQAAKSRLDKLLVLHKRALRFIHFANSRDHAIPLFLNTIFCH